jgi:ribosome-associated toxin RatA of RatAB toxin-antitoxin module
MPLVEVYEHVSAPLKAVWDAINDVESHPRLMPPVESVEVLERAEDHRLVVWQVDLKGCVMRWVEREEIDADRWRIDYRQVEGELAMFEGHWQLEPTAEDRTLVTLVVRFDTGMPMLAEMLDPIAERAIRENAEIMLRSLSSHLVDSAR